MKLSLVLLALVVLAAPAFADDPVKDEATLDQDWKGLAHLLAGKEVALAKKLDKAGAPVASFRELLLAIELDPDDAPAREKLGYKKEGADWHGIAVEPAGPDGALDPSLGQDQAKERKEAAKKIAALAKRAKAGGLEAPARRLAGIALDIDPDDPTARAVLGHAKQGAIWLSPRETAIRTAFAKFLDATKGDAPRDNSGPENDQDQALAKLIAAQDLARYESDHAVVLKTKAAPAVDLALASRSAEACYAACRYYLAGDGGKFSVDEPHRTQTGSTFPGPNYKPRFLFVAEGEHVPYVRAVIEDPKEQGFYEKLNSTASWVKVAGKEIVVYETDMGADYASEFSACYMVGEMTVCRLPPKSELPDFVEEGFRRFFAGHISGRADLIFVGQTSRSKSDDAWTGGAFEDFRARVRGVLARTPPGNLRALLSKNQNDFGPGDPETALAFLDFCLDAHRGDLVDFLSAIKADEIPLTTFERVWKKSVEDVEKEFREWVREQY